MENNDLLDGDLLQPIRTIETDWFMILSYGLIFTAYSLTKYYFVAVFSESILDKTINNPNIYLASVILLNIFISLIIATFSIVTNSIELILVTRKLKFLGFLEEGISHTLITSAIYQLMTFAFISAFHDYFPYTELDNFPPIERLVVVLVFVFFVLIVVAKNTRKRVG